MDTPECPLNCGIPQLYCHKPPADYYICREIGLIFQRMRPSTVEMAEHADAEYTSGLYRDYVAAAPLKYETFKRRVELIGQYANGGRLLDVGCSSGFFMEVALRHGFDAYGIEFSRQAVALAKEEIRGRITHGDVNSLRDRGEQRFDVIVGFDIIEHTQDPFRFLGEAREMLSPQGWLVLSTPDTGHFLRYAMGSRWPMLQPWQHTYLFSKKAMRKTLEMAGYENIQIQNAHKTLTLEYLMGQIRVYNPWLAKTYRAFSLLLPRAIRAKPFSVNIGEMLVFCKKGS